MANSIYIASPEGETGKSTVALGLVDMFTKTAGKVGIYRPVVRSGEPDALVELLIERDSADLTYDDVVGITYEDLHEDPEAALSTIVQKYREVESKCDLVVIIGSDYTDVAGSAELAFNARVAANLGAPVLLTVRGARRTPDEIRQVAELGVSEITAGHASVVGVIANRADGDEAEIRAALGDALPVWIIPEHPLLSAPTVGDLKEALGGTVLSGDEALFDREAESLLVCGMGVEHILERLAEGQVAIAAGDRSELLISLLAAHAAEGFPSLAGIILNGGYQPAEIVTELVSGFASRLPIITCDTNTYETAQIVATTRGGLTTRTQRKIDTTLQLTEKHLPTNELAKLLEVAESSVVTPLMFEAELLDRAKRANKHIVLPEGKDDRILRAASTLLARGTARLTILGQEAPIRARAAELGLAIDDARILDPTMSDYLEEFAAEYTRLRAHKGMTEDRAKEIVRDVSYFGTLMVHLGYADGMVSGATHTTAHTIKPSFEIIKTSPGTSIVSSVFLMLLADRVLVYGDCAVNPDPSAAQLADIAISSAATAEQFGIDPRVAMLSYSTGSSGFGADVDKVREATEIVRERAPELLVEGPIQYDAAVDAAVASTKMPDSKVAGRATVFVFPDLNTGNNTYKAVQRSAGAVAVGPVLQGLNKPVNDLSRGALVHDIVNTVAITAIQAEG
ncbi:phosphate acetyltransferase [Bowdeniella nasicola]|uniref:Phosphate acetyltransferase n=1 Tax=Bowdeniella nasicola TaxID=208480 RepID=A0A1Q5Q3L3_9ACTO|nr:phosphate acetyltransferase [Bowdeniella nasicola]OKL54387.1 phosphate acetyltransferase [Bowdeniella nasicola]